MSTMQIEVIANPVSTIPTKTGSYQVVDLAYKNKSYQDKLEGKKVMSFTNKDVFATLSKAQFGDVFNVSRVKNDKGFWDWTAVSTGDVVDNASSAPVGVPAGNAIPSVKTGTVSPKSTYETPEERAARQVLIVRQSSISSAVEFAVANKIKDEEEVLRLAKRFEAFVFGKEVTTYQTGQTEEATGVGGVFADFKDDIPY